MPRIRPDHDLLWSLLYLCDVRYTDDEYDSLEPLLDLVVHAMEDTLTHRSERTSADLEEEYRFEVHLEEERRRAAQPPPPPAPFVDEVVALEFIRSPPTWLGAVCERPPDRKPGVYVLLNDADDVLYVGQASDIRGRLPAHANDHAKRTAGWTRWRAWHIPDKRKRDYTEHSMIGSLNPPLNKAGRTN